MRGLKAEFEYPSQVRALNTTLGTHSCKIMVMTRKTMRKIIVSSCTRIWVDQEEWMDGWMDVDVDVEYIIKLGKEIVLLGGV